MWCIAAGAAAITGTLSGSRATTMWWWNGWRDIGYHSDITLEGVVYRCRPVERMGAHALGYNAHSIGICDEAVLSPSGCISDTLTPAQKEAMKLLILRLHREFPDIKTILGHRDLPHAESLSLLRCHEASASAGFIASHEILPTCMFWQDGGFIII